MGGIDLEEKHTACRLRGLHECSIERCKRATAAVERLSLWRVIELRHRGFMWQSEES
jgi:hypothetical protein